MKLNLKFAALKLTRFMCVRASLAKQRQNSVLWQRWAVLLKGLEGEGKDCEADATFPLTFQQLVQPSEGTLPSDPIFAPSPVHFHSVSSIIFTVPTFLELLKHLSLEETLPSRRSLVSL